jgi:hypothetical protein
MWKFYKTPWITCGMSNGPIMVRGKVIVNAKGDVYIYVRKRSYGGRELARHKGAIVEGILFIKSEEGGEG